MADVLVYLCVLYFSIIFMENELEAWGENYALQYTSITDQTITPSYFNQHKFKSFCFQVLFFTSVLRFQNL